MPKILIVEDELQLAEIVGDSLEAEGHEVTICVTAEDALERLQKTSFDLLILDWALPGTSGVDLCKQFRTAGGTTFILMLTGKGSVDEKEIGLDAGMDDYLTKPFDIKELKARVRALLRREPRPSVVGHVRTALDIRLDSKNHQVTKGGQPVHLHPKEFALLEFLMKNPGRVFSPEELLNHIWESDSEASPDTVKLNVTRLRKKIDTDGQDSIICTVHGVGYKIEAVTETDWDWKPAAQAPGGES